jgi:hypothetical protein
MVHLVDAKARLRAVRERGGTVVVIDPRRTETARIATEHQFIRPGTDAVLLLAMVHTIFDEGLQDRAFLAEHTDDAAWLESLVAPFTPERAAETTGIDADTIRRLAREFAAAPSACAFGRAVCGPFGTLQAWALEVLNVVTGNLDRPGGAVFSDGLIDMAKIVQMLGLDGYGEHRSRVDDRRGVLGELPARRARGRDHDAGPGPDPRARRDGGQSGRLDRERPEFSPSHARARVHGRDRHLHERDGCALRLRCRRRPPGSSARTSRSST